MSQKKKKKKKKKKKSYHQMKFSIAVEDETCARCAPNKSKKEEKKNLIYPLKYQVECIKCWLVSATFFLQYHSINPHQKDTKERKIQDNNVAEKC